MSSKKKTQTVSLAGGGKATLVPNERGLGAVIYLERGYRETEVERQRRLAEGPRAHVFASGKHKSKGGRGDVRRQSIRESF